LIYFYKLSSVFFKNLQIGHYNFFEILKFVPQLLKKFSYHFLLTQKVITRFFKNPNLHVCLCVDMYVYNIIYVCIYSFMQSPDGDIIDCVLTHEQLAFDHPLLKGQQPLVHIFFNRIT
jgi:hypothetical protein